MKVVLVRSENLTNWWLIERAEHDGREWMEMRGANVMAFMRSARVSDADVEGDATEMLAIADAIQRGESVYFRRCAAERTPNGYLLSSPRNSTRAELITFEEASALALDIRAKLAGSVVAS